MSVIIGPCIGKCNSESLYFIFQAINFLLIFFRHVLQLRVSFYVYFLFNSFPFFQARPANVKREIIDLSDSSEHKTYHNLSCSPLLSSARSPPQRTSHAEFLNSRLHKNGLPGPERIQSLYMQRAYSVEPKTDFDWTTCTARLAIRARVDDSEIIKSILRSDDQALISRACQLMPAAGCSANRILRAPTTAWPTGCFRV